MKIQTLSVFTHGGRYSVMSGATGSGWLKPAKFVQGMAPLLTAVPIVNLFACSVAGKVKVGEMNAVTGIQEALSAQLDEVYGYSFVEVWGHETAAHTTFNPNLGGTGPTGVSNLRSDLGGRMADALIEEMEYLGAVIDGEQRLKIEQRAADLIVNAAKPGQRYVFAAGIRKGDSTPPGKNPKLFTGYLNPMNVYFREIPLLGLERVWSDLTSAEAPTDYTDLGMSPEASERMVEGIAFFRARYADLYDDLRWEASILVDGVPEGPFVGE